MSEFSQTYGSFTRTGDYPLEANYIFATAEELKQFYQDNYTILHQGLLKIVGEGDNQALYWVVKEGNTLLFKKLIEKVDRDTIYQDLTNLHKQLQEEIANRENADSEIWGGEVSEEFNSIKKLADALSSEIQNLDKLHNEFNAAIGSDNEDIISYLQTLPYSSLTEISQTLNNFLNKADSTNTTINTFKELQSFLEGITDSNKLIELLSDLKNELLGFPNPTLNTLRKIEDAIVILTQVTKNREDNIQVELNTTQSSIGLNQDGSYSPDASTNYLASATSIMNALRILDNLIHTALSGISLEKEDSSTIALTISNGNKIQGNVKLSNTSNNQLISKDDGLYNSVELDYQSGILQLKVNGNIINSYTLGFSSLVEDAYYDTTTENIVITFKLLDNTSQTIRIPVGNLIREWEPDNVHPDKVVELIREESYGGGADKLSADVRLSTQADNLLVKDGNTLYVSRDKLISDVLTLDWYEG